MNDTFEGVMWVIYLIITDILSTTTDLLFLIGDKEASEEIILF